MTIMWGVWQQARMHGTIEVAERLHLIQSPEAVEGVAHTLSGDGGAFKIPKACPQRHTSSNKAIHPNPFQAVLPTADRIHIYVPMVAILIQIITGRKQQEKKSMIFQAALSMLIIKKKWFRSGLPSTSMEEVGNQALRGQKAVRGL